MTNRVLSRVLRAGAAFTATAAMLAAGALSATPAHAETIKELGLQVTPQASTVAAFADTQLNLRWTGCRVTGLEVEELVAGVWKTVASNYEIVQSAATTCAADPTSTAKVGLLKLLGYSYESGYKSLPVGRHTLRVSGLGAYEARADGDYWDIADGKSNAFQLTVVKATTTFAGWSTKTITVKPGAKFTLPAISISNPGGYDNLVIAEINDGFGWVCAAYKCSSSTKSYDNDALSTVAKKVSPGKNWTLPIRFRYRVLSNAYVTGGYSPVFTVKFTSGISKSKSTKISLKVSGTQKYGKSQATIKATVSSSKATGVVGFSLYKLSSYGEYEVVYTPVLGPVVSKGRVTYKFSKKVARKGTYRLVANFQSKNPKKYRDSIKVKSFTIK